MPTDAPERFNGRPVDLQAGHRPTLDVAVLAADPRAFVEYHLLALATPAATAARVFWKQSEHFAANLRADRYEASPLHLYYMMLNAVKTLILIRDPSGASAFHHHGMSYKVAKSGALNHGPLPGRVEKRQHGVFPKLCAVMGDVPTNQPLEELAASIVSVHRAYCTVRSSVTERFVPLRGPIRLRQAGDLRFVAVVPQHLALGQIEPHLPSEWRRQFSAAADQMVVTVRSVSETQLPTIDFVDYHCAVRRQVDVINSRAGLSYYLRRTDHPPVPWTQITLNFVLSFALSSLSRYHPDVLNDIYDSPNGWLIKEYLRIAPHQFLALVAGEITGRIIQTPYGDLS